MGFGSLRVINEDRVEPAKGFDTHGHRDMEIISYVLAGALEHADSLGNKGVIRPGEVQRMTAGTGVRHSEYNASSSEIVHFLQIWIVPERNGLEPGYEQTAFSDAGRRGQLRLVGSHDGRDGSVLINQDVDLYSSLLEPGEDVAHELEPGRRAWLQLVRGGVAIDGERLDAGDGAAIENLAQLIISATSSSEFLLFDLA